MYLSRQSDLRQRGDTIIEVLVAMTVLSLVVVTCYSIMTRGIAHVQISLERTTTQAMLAGEAAILRDAFRRYAQTSDPANSSEDDDWDTITSPGYVNELVENVSIPADSANGCSVPGVDRFYFDPLDETNPRQPKKHISPLQTVRAGTIPKYGDGMWIEGYKVEPLGPAKPYYDFYIKACWDSPYGGVRQALLTTVRLYDTKQ